MLSTSEEIKINKSAFQGLNNLQFLYFNSNTTTCTPEGLDCFPDKLILLHWENCPLRIWPSKFSANLLVKLIMQNSNLEMLWEGIKPLPCLKMLDLSSSLNLKKIPDLSEATSLEDLRLRKCRSLLELTNSISNATKLYRLDISGCTNIENFPNVSDRIKELVLCNTGIKEVPPWIENLIRLRELKMCGCGKLKTISPNVSKLESLQFLCLRKNGFCDFYGHCDDARDVMSVYRHNLFEARIVWRRGPVFKRCWRLWSDLKVDYILPICLPEKAFTSPTSLRLRSFDGIKTIPDCIRRLSGLIELDVKECRSLVALPPLPDSLLSFDAQGCDSLKRIDSSSFQNPNICLNFAKCFNLKQKARKLIQTSACKYVVLPGEEVPSHFTHRSSSDSLTINLTPRPLPSSFRFKACILLSKVLYYHGDKIRMSYFVRGKQNGLSVRGRSNQLCMPDLDEEHLYIFEDSVCLNHDFPEAEEITFSEVTFVFRFDYSRMWKVKGCGVRLLEANNESAVGEYEEKDDYDEENDKDEEDDDDDDEENDEDDDDDQKMLPNQPLLPSVPPPSNSHVMPHSSDSLSNQSSPFSRGTPSSGGPIRHMPPHPSAIPQYSSNPYASLPPRTSTVQTFGYNQGGAGTTEQQQSGPSIDPQSGTGMTSYPPPISMQSGYSRPFYGNPMHQGGDKQQQNMLPVPQSLNPHSIPQQLPSMQLLQLQCLMQPPQHVRPSMQISQPSEQGLSLQNQYQIPLHPMQMMQQTQVQPYYRPPRQQEISYQIPFHPMQLMQQTQVQPYYRPPQQQDLSYVQQQQPQQQAVQGQQGAGSSQRQECGMSLNDYFQSPETIQALLNNRKKLCELLEQDPKLMQMLQEKLGQL